MVIIVATDEEYKFASEKFGDKHKVIQTGVAGPNTIATLKDFDKSEKLLSLGFVGSNHLAVGTVVKVKDVALYHPNCTFKEETYPLEQNFPENILKAILATGIPPRIFREEPVSCLTNNDFVLATKITEPVVFDMELVYLPALGFKHVSALKIVSDNLDLHAYTKTVLA